MRDCAFVYDIGKLVIPEKIGASAVALSAKARTIVESHADAGAQILALESSRLFRTAALLAAQHHERYDGHGYPKGVSRDEIFLGARIVAVADVLAALTHDRADRKALALGLAFAQIRRESGAHFDPAVVIAMDRARDKIAELDRK
jgi:putative two-component system response regulator